MPKKKRSHSPDAPDHESLPSVMARDNTCDWGLIMGSDRDDEESSWSSGSSFSTPPPKPTRRRNMSKNTLDKDARRGRSKSRRSNEEVNSSSSLLALRPITQIFNGVNMKMIVLCIIGTQCVLMKTRDPGSSHNTIVHQMTRDLKETVVNTRGLRGAMDYLGVELKADEQEGQGTQLVVVEESSQEEEEVDSTSTKEAVFGQNKGFQTLIVQSQQGDVVPQQQAFDPSQYQLQQEVQAEQSQQLSVQPDQGITTAPSVVENCESRMWHESKVEGMTMTCTNDGNHLTSWSTPQKQKYYLFSTAQKCCETRFGQECNVVDSCSTTQHGDDGATGAISLDTAVQQTGIIPQVQPMTQDLQNDSQTQQQQQINGEGQGTLTLDVAQQQQSLAGSGEQNTYLLQQPDLVVAQQQQQPWTGITQQMQGQSQQLSVQPQQDVVLAQQQQFFDPNHHQQQLVQPEQYQDPQTQQMIHQPVLSPQPMAPQQGDVQQPHQIYPDQAAAGVLHIQPWPTKEKRARCKPSIEPTASASDALLPSPPELEPNFRNHATSTDSTFTESSSGSITRTSIGSRESVWTRKTFKEERTLQRIHQLQQRFDRLSQDATRGTETEYLDAKFDAGGLGSDTNEILNLIDSLQEINEQSQEKIQQIHTQLIKVAKERNTLLNDNEKLTSQNESMTKEVEQWKEKHRCMEKSNYKLIEQMAEKVLSQSEEWKQNQEQIQQQNSALQQTIGELTSDNEQLMAIQQSMEESMQLASGMSHKMANFVEVHEASTQSYEERLASLNKELQQSHQSQEELFNQFLDAKKENRSLHSELKETEDLERYYQEQMVDMHAEREALEHERNEAIRKCREIMSGNGKQDSLDSTPEVDKEKGVGKDISRSSF